MKENLLSIASRELHSRPSRTEREAIIKIECGLVKYVRQYEKASNYMMNELLWLVCVREG
jgi:hypothetical protein